MNELVIHLLETGGPSGVIMAVSYLYIRALMKELHQVQEKRVEDNKAMAAKLLDLNDKWAETINSQSELIEQQRATMTEMRGQLEGVRGQLDRLTTHGRR